MGVTGLWRLIEPAGKPVPVENLENKVLAVDISIWLHQMVKGYQDAKGAPLPNAHLMGLFQRLCKLLYFRIKPVFVFDGGFPDLKKETIARRQDHKAKYNSESERIKRELALLLSKKTAISSLLGKDISPKKGKTINTDNNDDLFKLPALPETKQETESESDDEESSGSSIVDLHSVDIESNSFKSMPVKEKYDLLIELKETRKMNSWGKLNELPKKSDNFSDFQMQRLLKRRKVQECLEETEKEMGDGGMSLNELESLLNEEGIDTKIDVIPTRRIASKDNTTFLLLNNVKQALAAAKQKKEQESNPGTSKEIEEVVPQDEKHPVKDELEEDLEKAIKMSLECVDNHDTSHYTSKTDESWTSALTDSDYTNTDSEEEDGYEQPDMSSAKAYIMQYTDYTAKAIDQIVSTKNVGDKNKQNKPDLDKILEEINREKSIILEKIDLMSDDEYIKPLDQATNIESGNADNIKPQNDEADIDISASQASVIYVQNSAPDIVTLNSSGEESALNSSAEKQSEMANHSALDESSKDYNVPGELPVKVEENSSEDEFEDLCEVSNQKAKSELSNSSEDDEFEDVPEIVNQAAKSVVVIDIGQACDEEDIFSDVFTSHIKNDPPSKINSSSENYEDMLQSIEKTENIKASAKIGLISDSETRTTPVLNNVKEDVPDKSNKTEARDTVFVKTNNVEKALTQIKENVTVPEEVSDVSNNLNETDVQDKSKNKPPVREVISTEKLNEMAEVVANEEQNLIQEKGRLDRVGRNITEQMTKEAQELLQLFGIPYIVAPMEAEAQCAFLENVKLTDGTITDDSDIWLFGGKTVYKNFFNQKKHVLQFLSERIEKSFNLTREQLILLALLVGSDYTTGVDGVGPVTAMEILASFPFNKKQLLNETSKQGRYQQIVTGMQEFKRWVRAGKRTDNTSLKKKLRNVTLNDDFPSVRVVQAYLEPNVEKSEDKFTWGEIDITVLRDYTKAKFGWSQNKLDELMKPVLKRLLERKTQKTVQDYFKRKVEFQTLEHQMSKRVKAAVQKMGPEELVDGLALNECDLPNLENPSKPSRKRKTPKSKTKSSDGAGPSKVRITTSSEISDLNVKAIAHVENTASGIEIVIPKTDRFQEIIPQREKDKQSLLQNKMKAIELFRKTKMDRKKKVTKRKAILPKEKAELSESSDGD